MEIINPSFMLDEFWKRLRRRIPRLLMLDYDGTLAPFVVEREKAAPYAGVPDRINGIINSGRTRVVIVSGRSVETIQRLLPLRKSPEIWGCHGAERFHPESGLTRFPLPDAVCDGFRVIESWAVRSGYAEHMEVKPAGRAFHWRGMSAKEIENMRRALTKRWQDDIDQFRLAMRLFDGGMEFKFRDIDKGSAVRRIVSEEADECVMAYLGDDATDEDAFAALSGRGLKVLVSRKSRPTAADIQIAPPDELYRFLDDWLNNSAG